MHWIGFIINRIIVKTIVFILIVLYNRDIIQGGSYMLVNYKGKLGEFTYDDSEYRLETFSVLHDVESLHYIGDGKSATFPKGILDCFGMFYGVQFKEGFKFIDFDTSGVLCMKSMFEKAVMSSDFSFPDEFSTKNCKDFSYMFADAKLNDSFELGEGFDTVGSMDMQYMFCNVEFKNPEALLRLYINPHNTMYMFKNCVFPDGFRLSFLYMNAECGDCMLGMFAGTKFNSDFFVERGGIEYADKTPDLFSESTVFSELVTRVREKLPERLKDLAVLRDYSLKNKFTESVWLAEDATSYDNFLDLVDEYGADYVDWAWKVRSAFVIARLEEALGLFEKDIKDISREDLEKVITDFKEVMPSDLLYEWKSKILTKIMEVNGL